MPRTPMYRNPLDKGRRRNSVTDFLRRMTWRPLTLRTDTGLGRSEDRRPSSAMRAPDAARNRALISADREKREARRQRSAKSSPFTAPSQGA